MAQYTIRNISDSIDRELRNRARRNGTSLNETTLEVIKRGLGIIGSDQTYDDLDDLIGTWQPDEIFDQAIADLDTVDDDLWQ
ncbi:MAG: FitA-like ribbon-helix-helix domain-containing protein [Alkalispirochaeta sp.]